MLKWLCMSSTKTHRHPAAAIIILHAATALTAGAKATSPATQLTLSMDAVQSFGFALTPS